MSDNSNGLADYLHASVEKFRKRRIPINVTIEMVMNSAVELAASAINNLPADVRSEGIVMFMRELMDLVDDYADEETNKLEAA